MTSNVQLTETQIAAHAKYLHVLEKARIRQKKWYDLNKPKVLEKKKQEWKKLRSEILGINHSQYNQNAIINEPSSTDEQHYDHTQEDNNYHNDTQQQTVEPTPMPKLRKSGRPKVVIVTIQHIIKSLDEKISKQDFTASDKEGTINTRLGDMKTIQRIMPNCKNFKKCLEKPDELIDSIKNADKKNENRRNPDASTKYKTNSRKTYFATILWVIDAFPNMDISKEIKQKYIQTLDLLKQKSTQEHDLKKQNSEYINFNTMVEKIKIKFGKESKEYLLIRFYDLICARDNYCKMIIVENKNEISDEDKFNYMIIPKDKKKNCIIFLQEFKTNGRYNNAEEKCNMDLSKLIRDYIQAKKINYGEFIFGKTSLSKFIGFMLDSIEAKRENEAINYLRHSKLTTEFLTKNLSNSHT